MILPINGRIVLIDNKYNEIEPILNLLSQNRIPYNYYDGTFSFLPKEPCNEVRIIFLDLELVEGARDKNSISIIAANLKRIVPPNPSPYIIAVWSKHTSEEGYKNLLKELFEKQLANIAPVKIISISKNKYMKFEDEKWQLEKDGQKKLNKDLIDELKDHSILVNFIKFENLVHQATSKLISDISHDIFDNNWNKNTKSIIYNLAQAVMGKSGVEDAKDSEKLKAAFLLSNQILKDRIQELLNTEDLGKIDRITFQGINEDFIVRLNTKFHLTKVNVKSQIFVQGNLYTNKRRKINIKKILDGVVSGKTVQKQNIIKKILNDKPVELRLDITPACDYSNKKDYSRLIFGVGIKAEHLKNIKDTLFTYKEKIIFNVEDEKMFFVFDFRTLKSYTHVELKNLSVKPKYRLNQELITDIQAQLSNQINRPGISTVVK